MAFVESECPTRRCHTLAVVVTTVQSQEVDEGLIRFCEAISHAREDLERWQVEDGQAGRRLPNLDLLHAAGLTTAGASGDNGRFREASHKMTMRRAPTPACGGRDGAQGGIHLTG